MKRLLIIFTLMALSLPASSYAQTNLSDNFAKASLRALSAIKTESDTGMPSMDTYAQQRSGQVAVERINDADAEARTDVEKAVVKLLRNFSFAKSVNNTQRATSDIRRMMAATSGRGSTAPSKQDLARGASEQACSDAIEKALRDRNFPGTLPACDMDLVTGKKD